jgi:hypothetical protein
VTLEVDHLVVGAATLEQGVAWCEATLGVVPAAGGRHALMGTHNRLLAIGGAAFPQAYLEIIAVDPDAPPPARPRWFGLDEPEVRERLAAAPQLLHWVACTHALDADLQASRALGVDPGPVVAAQRETPAGTLRWQLTIPDDGRPRAAGAWPTLIAWDGPHPSANLPPSGVTLRALRLGGLPAGAAAWIGHAAEVVGGQAPALAATLETPRGVVVLDKRR